MAGAPCIFSTICHSTEALRASLLIQRKAAKVLAETKKTLMIPILSDGFFQAIHVGGCIIFALSDQDVFSDAGHGELLLAFQPVEVRLRAHGVHKL